MEFELLKIPIMQKFVSRKARPYRIIGRDGGVLFVEGALFEIHTASSRRDGDDGAPTCL